MVCSYSGLRKDLLRETHDSKWAGHPREERTLALLARSHYWPKMGEDGLRTSPWILPLDSQRFVILNLSLLW